MKRTIPVLTVLALAAMAMVIIVGSNSEAEAGTTGARVVRWVDGDTVATTEGTVRLIGVNTPEVGRCGADKATALARRLAPAGSRIRLGNPVSMDNRDKYGRLLRYVNRPNADVGLRLIKAGAIAMYDGRDGYDWHKRQATYHRADRANRNYCSTGGDLRSYAPASTWKCPRHAPIKGNASSMIYHMRGQAYYAATTPEECFASRAGAEHHGYRPAMI
jgi:endonuclease YncB( thermonuclease family)